MSLRELDPRSLDLGSFCRSQSSLSGARPLAAFERLAQSFSARPDGAADWSVDGTTVSIAGAVTEVWLHLRAHAVVPLQCQRCLQTLAEPLRVDRRLRFVRSDDEAARLDEELDDDVLVLPPRLDLHELVEDELILALPLVPRHAHCPDPLPLQDDDVVAQATPAPNPFAVLASLRKGDGRGS